jgi:transposase
VEQQPRKRASPEVAEFRRLRAWDLKERGWKQRAIAQALGVTDGAVSQWFKRGRDGGVAALRRRKPKGGIAKLTALQWVQLPEVLDRGAEAFGVVGQVWTTRRIAFVIQREFGVRYSRGHISKLMAKLRRSVQKPAVRATQRNEAAIDRWKTERWPELKKSQAEGWVIVWVDEAGFYLLPGCVRTYAPVGQTPVLRVKLTRDHLAAIAAVTATGKLYLGVQEPAFDGPAVVRFLKHLLRLIGGKVLVIWDGLPAHRGEAVRQFLASEEGKRVWLEQLPGYAPELNPVEGLWAYLTGVELRNACFTGLARVWDALTAAVARVRHRRAVIQGFIKQVGYATL